MVEEFAYLESVSVTKDGAESTEDCTESASAKHVSRVTHLTAPAVQSMRNYRLVDVYVHLISQVLLLIAHHRSPVVPVELPAHHQMPKIAIAVTSEQNWFRHQLPRVSAMIASTEILAPALHVLIFALTVKIK